MKRVRGIAILFGLLCLFMALSIDAFSSPQNIENLIRRSAPFGILSIAAAFVIITGGIDLSIGSVICLTGCGLPWLLTGVGMPIYLALPLLGLVCASIGWIHGTLITRLGLQPFLVTLCGLLVYRGITRGIMDDTPQGFGGDFQTFKLLTREGIPISADFSLPVASLYLLVVAVTAALFLRRTIWGQYLFAMGRNEEAARFSGVDTGRMTVLAYVTCALLSGLGGVLLVAEVNVAQPSDFGNFYELYAIAGAVLGGCALRGGEGAILGVVIGAALMQVLRNAINLSDVVPQKIEFAVIGLVILAGVVADELVKRAAARRRLKRAQARDPS